MIQLMDALEYSVGRSSSATRWAVSSRRRWPSAHRGRVSRLVLLGIGAVSLTMTRSRNCGWRSNQLTDPVDDEFVREFQYSTIAQPVPEAFMEAAIVKQPPHAGRNLEAGSSRA